jgi:hypothetical protein
VYANGTWQTLTTNTVGPYVYRAGDTMTGTLVMSSPGVFSNQSGSAAAPSYTFTSNTAVGLYLTGSTLGFSTSGTSRLTINTVSVTSTLPIRLPNGSESAPALTFASDTNTGIFLPTANTFAITTNGSEKFSIDPNGSISQNSGSFATEFDAQVVDYVLRNTTTNATPTQLFIDGSSIEMLMAVDTTWTFDVLITGRRIDSYTENAAFRIQGCIVQNSTASTTALVGGASQMVIARNNTSWVVSAQADVTNGALSIYVTGEVGATIRWVAAVKTVQVSG